MREVVDVLFVFAPSAGYVVQANAIRQAKSAAGYSLESSLILLLCNSLRIIYFAGEPFAIALLLQSVVMIAVQMALVLTVLKLNLAASYASNVVSPAHGFGPGDDPDIDDESPAQTPAADPFRAPTLIAQPGALPRVTRVSSLSDPSAVAHWAPRRFVTIYVCSVVAIAAASLAAFSVVPWSARVMGYLAMGVEATLIIPQVLLNRRRKSCEGLAMTLVVTWVLGDMIKACYLVVLAQPAPFVVCVCVQLCIDSILVAQLFLYRRSPLCATSEEIAALAFHNGGAPGAGGDASIVDVAGGHGDEVPLTLSSRQHSREPSVVSGSNGRLAHRGIVARTLSSGGLTPATVVTSPTGMLPRIPPQVLSRSPVDD